MISTCALCIRLSGHQCRYQVVNYKNRNKLLQYIFDNQFRAYSVLCKAGGRFPSCFLTLNIAGASVFCSIQIATYQDITMNVFKGYLVLPINRVREDAHEGDLWSAIGLLNTLVRFFSPAMNTGSVFSYRPVDKLSMYN